MGTQRLRRSLCWLAAAGALLAVTSELTNRLGWQDPDTLELLQDLSAGLNVGALVALALGSLGLALDTRSAWWIVATVAMAVRVGMACVELLAFDVTAGPPAAGLLAMAGLTVVAAWGSLGLATVVRRRDGARALGGAAGAVIGAVALAFSGLYLGFSSGEHVPTHQIVLLDLSQALSLVGLGLLSAFLLSASSGPELEGPIAPRRLSRGLATVGAVLMGTSLGAIIYAAPVGWMASEATTLAGLIVGLAGLVLFGWAPWALRPGPTAFVVTGVVWGAALALGLVVIFDTSRAMTWAAAGLSSLAMIACGSVLLAVRGPGARPAWVGGGLFVLSSLVGMTWAALGLNEANYEVREVLRVLTTIGFLAGFCLAAVALLNGAGRTDRPEGGAA